LVDKNKELWNKENLKISTQVVHVGERVCWHI